MRHTKRLALFTAVCLTAAPFIGLSAPANVYAAAGYTQVATQGEMAKSQPVKKIGMVPIRGIDVKDGSYTIDVSSSSAFFRISKAVLTVKDGKMHATITVPSESYSYLYQGTGQEASKAKKADFIEGKKASEGTDYDIDVSGLNEEISIAAFSKSKKKWYDRTLLFDASTLSDDKAIDFEVPNYNSIDKAVTAYNNGQTSEKANNTQTVEQVTAKTKTEPMKIDKKDGEYSIDISMTGGSGRASVSSPTLMIVKDGKAYAQLVWSSTYYDYMIVGGRKYLNRNAKSGGNSTFVVPISAMDEPVPVIGDTTAMDSPVEIDYQITYYSDSIGGKNLIPQEAAKRVIAVGLIIIVVGFIINQFFRRSRYKV